MGAPTLNFRDYFWRNLKKKNHMTNFSTSSSTFNIILTSFLFAFQFLRFSSVILKSFELFHETPFTQMFTKLIHFHFGPSPSQLMTSLGRARILINRSTKKKRRGNNWRQLKRERESTSHSFLDRRAKNRNPNREEEKPVSSCAKKSIFNRPELSGVVFSVGIESHNDEWSRWKRRL